MVETTVNVEELFKKYGLQVEEIEPAVYKVLNTNKIVNITKLQLELQQCFLITPIGQKTKRMPDGFTEYFSNVYYIITECDYNLANKYEGLLCGDVTSIRYDYTDYIEPYIGTLYGKEEIEYYGQQFAE